MVSKVKPELYIHVGEATHFLRWELPEFSKHFKLVDTPSEKTPMLIFGPDVLESSLSLPALKRYAVLFPGFGHNPLYNMEIKAKHDALLPHYDLVFINPGPLEIAYREHKNIVFYPFSIDIEKVGYEGPRRKVKNIIHISSDYPQKDWGRSAEIMRKTGLKWEVYPKREEDSAVKKVVLRLRKYLYQLTRIPLFELPVHGYVSHDSVVRKYKKSDAFIHAAKDIKDPLFIDGKYTATLIEAGLSGCIVFWHDTFNLGNTLETVFSVSLDPDTAAIQIKSIIAELNVKEHSEKTHQEMLDKFNPENSVRVRAEAIINSLEVQ